MSSTFKVQLVGDAEVRHVGVQAGLITNGASRGKVEVRVTHCRMNRGPRRRREVLSRVCINSREREREREGEEGRVSYSIL